jgi:hypothetical protein
LKRTTIRGVRITREPHERPDSLDHLDAAGNLIDTLGQCA